MDYEHSLNQYRIFYTTAQVNNISRASEILFISQPAVSKAIRKLEENLGTMLFKRNQKGVELTYDGKILYEKLKTAFDAIYSAEEQLKYNSELGIGRLKIGASATLCRYLLLPYLRNFIADNPHIKVTIECQSSTQSQKLLDDEKIDIAIVTKPQNKSKTEFIPTWELEDIFVATKTYLDNLALRTGTTESSEILKHSNLMLMDEENITRLYVDSYLKQNNIQTKKVLDVTTMDLLIEFARIGMGIACVIKEFVADDLKNGRLIEIPLKTPMNKRTVGFAYQKSEELSPQIQAFLNTISDHE